MSKPTYAICRFSLFKRDHVRALVSIQVADSFILSGIRLIEGSKGLFVAMPSRKLPNGDYQDISFPSNKAVRDDLTRCVIERYEEEMRKAPAEATEAAESAAA